MEDVALSLGERLERRHAVGDDELRAEIGVDVAAAGRDAADRVDQLAVGRPLGYVAVGAGARSRCRTGVGAVCDDTTTIPRRGRAP